MGQMRSVEATRAAWNAPANGTELLLLQALAGYAGETFECHPSVPTLAGKIRKSERQTIRLLHRLRDRKLIHFEDNRGGQRKCNQYRLLYALNPVKNPDTANPDRISNPDISTSRTLTNSAGTLTKRAANPDIAMSEEGFKGSEWLKQWISQIEPLNHDTKSVSWESDFVVRGNFQAFQELEDANPLDLLSKIKSGIKVTRKANCEDHGPFMLTGWRFANWIAWAGRPKLYSSGWPGDDGSCPGCQAEMKELIASETEKFRSSFPRRFSLETPAICIDHGPLILKAGVREYPDSPYIGTVWEKVRIDEEWMNHCPDCESELVYEADVKESLGLSDGEWELRGDKVMAALLA